MNRVIKCWVFVLAMGMALGSVSINMSYQQVPIMNHGNGCYTGCVDGYCLRTYGNGQFNCYYIEDLQAFTRTLDTTATDIYEETGGKVAMHTNSGSACASVCTIATQGSGPYKAIATGCTPNPRQVMYVTRYQCKMSTGSTGG